MKLSDYFKQNDVVPTITVDTAFGRSLSRGEIEGALIDAGWDMPRRNVLFYLVDSNGKAYSVRYFADLDKFGYEKLTMK